MNFDKEFYGLSDCNKKSFEDFHSANQQKQKNHQKNSTEQLQNEDSESSSKEAEVIWKDTRPIEAQIKEMIHDAKKYEKTKWFAKKKKG